VRADSANRTRLRARSYHAVLPRDRQLSSGATGSDQPEAGLLGTWNVARWQTFGYRIHVTLLELRHFLRSQPWAVEATVSSGAGTQSAVVGIAITDELELVFDTLKSSRKHFNLQRDPRISFVVGWDAGCTAQVEGLADQSVGAELDRLKRCYFARFPDGLERANLPTIAYWRVRPKWIRFSDYNTEPPTLIEWTSQILSSFDWR
jgi:hypothetical protein